MLNQLPPELRNGLLDHSLINLDSLLAQLLPNKLSSYLLDLLLGSLVATPLQLLSEMLHQTPMSSEAKKEIVSPIVTSIPLPGTPAFLAGCRVRRRLLTDLGRRHLVGTLYVYSGVCSSGMVLPPRFVKSAHVVNNSGANVTVTARYSGLGAGGAEANNGSAHAESKVLHHGEKYHFGERQENMGAWTACVPISELLIQTDDGVEKIECASHASKIVNQLNVTLTGAKSWNIVSE